MLHITGVMHRQIKVRYRHFYDFKRGSMFGERRVSSKVKVKRTVFRKKGETERYFQRISVVISV